MRLREGNASSGKARVRRPGSGRSSLDGWDQLTFRDGPESDPQPAPESGIDAVEPGAQLRHRGRRAAGGQHPARTVGEHRARQGLGDELGVQVCL